jgi:hypothetical protein
MAHPFKASGAGVIVMGRACGQQTAQVALAKYNDMVQAFAAKRLDQTLGNTIFPRRLEIKKGPRHMRAAQTFAFGYSIIPDTPIAPGGAQSRRRRVSLGRHGREIESSRHA